jgi:hypothetical protein
MKWTAQVGSFQNRQDRVLMTHFKEEKYFKKQF